MAEYPIIRKMFSGENLMDPEDYMLEGEIVQLIYPHGVEPQYYEVTSVEGMNATLVPADPKLVKKAIQGKIRTLEQDKDFFELRNILNTMPAIAELPDEEGA